MNPYDINNFQSQTYQPSSNISTSPVLDIPALEAIHLPEVTSPQIDSHTLVKPQVSLQSIFTPTEAPKYNYAYTYTKDKDLRYDNPMMRYDPSKDMEKMYEDEQGQWGAFKTQMGNAANTFKNSWYNMQVGRGRTYANVVNLEGYEKIKNSFLNTTEQQNSYLNNINYMIENPVYNADDTDDSYFSMRGDMGSLVASSGFMGAAIVGAVQDTVLGQAMKAASKNPISAGILGALGVGTLALTNKSVQDTVGEDNANLLVGIMAGGGESFAISSGWDKLVKAKGSLAELQALRNAAKETKNNRKIFGQLGNYFDDKLYGITAGTVLDKTANLSKEILVRNTIAKTGKSLSTFGKMYLSSGAEAGVEALDSQAQYLQQKIEEDKDKPKDQKYYDDLKRSTSEVGQSVYDLNRVLLGLTGSMQLKDIVMGTSLKNIAERTGVSFVKGQFVPKYSVAKAYGKQLLVDNLSEGFEEFGQLAISKGTIAHALGREKNLSEIDAYFDATKGLISKEGFKAFMGGMIMGSMTNGLKGMYHGATALKEGKTFSEGFLGYDKEFNSELATHLNKSAKAFTEILQVSKTLNEDPTQVKEKITEAIFDHAASSIRLGTYNSNKQYLNELFKAEKDSDDYNLLIEAFGSENGIKQAKDEIFTKLDKAHSAIQNFNEYYNNPFTVNVFDNLFSKGKNTKQETREKAQLFDSLVNSASRVLFIQENKKEEFTKLIDDIRPALSNGNYDYTNYLTSNQSGWQTFKAQLEDDIFVLTKAEEIGISDGEKSRKKEIEKLKDKVDKFEANFEAVKKSLPENATDQQKEWHKKLEILTNPMFQFLQSEGTISDIRDLRKLENLQKTNEALTLVTNDLATLTNPATQKQYVEHLYNLRKTLLKGAEVKRDSEAPVAPINTVQDLPDSVTEPTQGNNTTATPIQEPVITTLDFDLNTTEGLNNMVNSLDAMGIPVEITTDCNA